jgi:hypothetical protein
MKMDPYLLYLLAIGAIMATAGMVAALYERRQTEKRHRRSG